MFDKNGFEAEEDGADEIDVEKDVYVKMPVDSTIVQSAKIRHLGNAEPSVILPEGVEDN